MSRKQSIERLEEIKDVDFEDLLIEALHIIKNHLGEEFHYEKAKNNWVAQIEKALNNKHGYLEDSQWNNMTTMQDTINELRRKNEENGGKLI